MSRSTTKNKETQMPAVKTYRVTPLNFDENLATTVRLRREGGESLSAIAKDLKMTPGKAAMCELVASTPRVAIEDPAKLARAIVKDRKAGKSWGYLAAKYGVTEGTCRAAYEAASGQPYTALDYRRRATQEAAPSAKRKRVTRTRRTRAKAAQAS
jgi:hypothetical protein